MDIFTATRPMAGMTSRYLHYLDRPLLRLTRGRVATTFGLPTLLLTTTGAKTGRPRSVPVLYLTHGDALAVIGSNSGRRRKPGWYYNLRAHPEAEVLLGGESFRCRAREASGKERAAIWQRATKMYAGYARYASRLRTREIPVVIMERAEPGGGVGEVR